MNDKYILNENREPVVESDLLTWARWFETADRQVARDVIEDTTISTVFLGLDHSFGASDQPVLWETMAFGGVLNQEQDRCAGTWDDALLMHTRMVRKVRRWLPPPKEESE